MQPLISKTKSELKNSNNLNMSKAQLNAIKFQLSQLDLPSLHQFLSELLAEIASKEKLQELDETEYLLSSPSNTKRLLDSIENVKKGNYIKKSLKELQNLEA